ncbi:MAG TPA: hypothetical protein VNY78_00670 [Edaphobacter sp.]|nr:hypothetical protein [Edaphobacter sp.]
MRSRLLVWQGLFVLLLIPLVVSAQSQSVRQVQLARSAPFPTTPPGNANAGQGPEVDSALVGDDADSGSDAGGPGIAINRTVSKAPGSPRSHGGNGKAKSNPELMLSIDGLNHFQQRFVAAGGNQFSVEPPDQGLCVGNGFVLETINDVLRVFDTAGNPVTAPTDLNSFYGYAPAIDRTKNPLQFGPSITDPSCTFDVPTQRWFHVVLTLDRANNLTQSLSGTNHLDLAVSATADPTGAWNIYRLPVQDDGTEGTPDHHCTLGTNPAHGPCLGDYPHLGADANGFYLTTNEFNLVSPGFHGAQIYAFPKAQLAAGASSVTVVQFDTADASLGVQLDGNPGFTVWPALSTGNVFEGSHGGTEYFLSSEAVFQNSGVDSRLRLWSLSNTSSLNGAPALGLNAEVVNTIPYAVPGRSSQKPGDVPLAQCLSDSTLLVGPNLFGCWRLVTGGSGPFPNTEKVVDSNDSRIQQVVLANGKLWAALDTGLIIDGDTAPRAGVAFFVINPHAGKVQQQGYAGILGNNLTYPALAVTQSGRGVMTFTVLGNDHYPSAGYAGIDAKIGVGDIHIAAEGVGPDDGFTGYHPTSAFGSRPRWGDYGSAATDGNAIWIASEYVNQTCTFDTFLNTAFRCGNTRTQLANWSTRISKIVP